MDQTWQLLKINFTISHLHPHVGLISIQRFQSFVHQISNGWLKVKIVQTVLPITYQVHSPSPTEASHSSSALGYLQMSNKATLFPHVLTERLMEHTTVGKEAGMVGIVQWWCSNGYGVCGIDLPVDHPPATNPCLFETEYSSWQDFVENLIRESPNHGC